MKSIFNILQYLRCFPYWFIALLFNWDLGALSVVIEGMPGAGKTTSLIELISELPEEFILLSETNPEPNARWQDNKIEDQTIVYHQIWVDRIDALKNFSKKSNYIFLLDRSYFSNLAFKYAFDILSCDNSYSSYFNLYKQELAEGNFSLIVVLDVDPMIGSYRRLKIDNPIPFPWSEKKFLEALRKFYIEELPKITQSQLIFINTDTLSPSEVKMEILKVLNSYFALNGKSRQFFQASQEEEILLEFGKKYNLGEKHSKLINIFGYPTIYFLRHSVQMVDGKPVFFNNNRLREIAQTAH